MAEDGIGAEVGVAYVSIIPSARGFAKKLRSELEREIKAANLDQLVEQAFGRKQITIPVKADFQGLDEHLAAQKVNVEADTTAFSEKIRVAAARIHPKVNVDLDVDKRGGLSGIAGRLTNLLPSGLTDALGRVGGELSNIVGLASTLSSAFSAVAGPVGAVISALVTAGTVMGGLSAAVVAGIPAFTTLAGVAASIPGALAGALAVFGTLGLGLKGISDAFKPAAGGGGGGGGGQDPAARARSTAAAERGVEAARRGVAAATRGVEAAQRNYLQSLDGVTKAEQRAKAAQLAVNKARQDAREDIEDLNRSLRGAKLSEEDATLGVEEALRALNAARLTGNLPDIARADLAYRQSLQTLDEAKDTTKDLQQATTDANKKGVEGSDKVRSALQDQRDATEAVKDAQNGVIDAQNGIASANDSLKSSYDGLASAQDSLASAQQKVSAGGSSAAQAAIKLAPAAQAFVKAIKDLKPAFDDLRMDVQQRLFAGLGGAVTGLFTAWDAPLHRVLGSYADTINGFLLDLGGNLGKPKFIADIEDGAEGARKAIEKIGKAVSGPLVTAFGDLASASAPFLSDLGGVIADMVTDFSNWVIQGAKSGKLAKFFERASQAMQDIFDIGGTVSRIIGDVFSIITGSSPLPGEKNPLQQFNDGLKQVADYLDDPQHQQQIRDYITSIQDGLIAFGRAVDRISGWLDKIFPSDTDGKSRSAGEAIGDALVAGLVAGVGAAMKKSLEIFLSYFLIPGVNTNTLIGALKERLGIHSPSTVMAEIGGDLIAGLIKGIGDSLASLGRYVVNIKTTVTNKLAGAGSWLYSHGKSVVTGLASGIGAVLSTASRYAGYARDAITNVFTKAGTLLYNAGHNIIAGLINGISSMVSSLGNYLGDVTQYIKDHKGPISKDRRLLVPAGQAIMAGLIEGIAGQKGALGDELGGVTAMFDTVGPQALGNPFSGFSAAASPGRIELAWTPGATGDPVLDGLRGLIGARWNGDPYAALSSR